SWAAASSRRVTTPTSSNRSGIRYAIRMNAIARQPDPTTANRVARREVDAHLVTTAAGMVAALHESIRRCSQANRVQGRWPEFGCSAEPTNIGMPRGPEPGLSRPHLGD